MGDSARRNLQRQLTQRNEQSMMQANQVANNELGREMPENADDVKTTTSRRNSYKYKVPVLDPNKQRQLKTFLVGKEEDGEVVKEQSNCMKLKKQLTTLDLSALYFVAMLFFQLFLITLYFVASFVTEQPQKKIALALLVSLTASFYSAWIYYASWRKDFIDRYWGWVWLSFMVNIFGAAVAGVSLWYISLIISAFIVFFDVLVLSHYRKTCFTGFLVIAISAYLFIIGIEITFVISGSYSINFVLAVPYICLFVLCILMILYQLNCKKKWILMTKQQKWQLVCCQYIMFCFLSFGLATGIDGKFVWVYLTQMINISFIGSTAYYMLFVVSMKSKTGNFNIYQKLKNIFSKSAPANPNIIYQMGEVLLTNDQQYFNNPRKSIIGKPLGECTNCFSQQSRFYYENCKHVCVGHQCVLDWLKKSIKKCPLCREISDYLIEIKRTRDLQFQIQNKYQFPSKPV